MIDTLNGSILTLVKVQTLTTEFPEMPFISDFSKRNDAKPPWKLNLFGILSSIGTAEATSTGKSKRQIVLIDANGLALEFSQLGSSAEDNSYKVGDKLLACYATIQKDSYYGKFGSAWLYDDAILVVKGHVNSLPTINDWITFPQHD